MLLTFEDLPGFYEQSCLKSILHLNEIYLNYMQHSNEIDGWSWFDVCVGCIGNVRIFTVQIDHIHINLSLIACWILLVWVHDVLW